MFVHEMITTRLVSRQECKWLSADVPAGTLVTLEHDRWNLCTPMGTFVQIIGWNSCPVELPTDCLVSLDTWARSTGI